MKALALTVFALTLTGSALANNAKCRATELSYNTHPDSVCPDYVAFCTEELEGGDMSIETSSGQVDKFKFLGLSRRNHSDVGGDIFNSYSGEGNQYMEVYFEADGYPVSHTGGYRDIRLSTGVQGRSGVYVSQLCIYKIK